MIRLQHTPHVQPIFVCDICSRRILDSSAGLAHYPAKRNGEELGDVYHVHRGSCHEKAQAEHAQAGGSWRDLIAHINDLRRDSGTTLKDLVLKEAGRRDLSLDQYNRLVEATNALCRMIDDAAPQPEAFA